MKKTSPYLLTQIAYATTTWQKTMPEICLAQNAWISVGFFSSPEYVPLLNMLPFPWASYKFPDHKLFSLSSEKFQWSNSVVQCNSSEAAICMSEMQMSLCCINSKAPSIPSHSCPSEILEHLSLYSDFLFPSLKAWSQLDQDPLFFWLYSVIFFKDNCVFSSVI